MFCKPDPPVAMLGDEIGVHEKKGLWFLQESGIPKNGTRKTMTLMEDGDF